MTCEQAKKLIAEELVGPLPAMSGVDLNSHLSGCAACRAEADLIRHTWEQMAAVPDPEPSPYLTTRFNAALNAYRDGMAEHRSWRLWPSRPAVQIAIAACCLIIGVFAGYGAGGKRTGGDDVAELRKEMSGMRQLVTLSLLQQQSANERLRGVSYSYRAEPDDMQVLSALLETANNDSSVDVRLAAVDALRNFSRSSVARRGLVQSLAKQDSPLAQIAIIDALADLRERDAVPAMRAMLGSAQLDENVRKRLNTTIRILE